MKHNGMSTWAKIDVRYSVVSATSAQGGTKRSHTGYFCFLLSILILLSMGAYSHAYASKDRVQLQMNRSVPLSLRFGQSTRPIREYSKSVCFFPPITISPKNAIVSCMCSMDLIYGHTMMRCFRKDLSIPPSLWPFISVRVGVVMTGRRLFLKEVGRGEPGDFLTTSNCGQST